jgi:hypothetical protein
MLKVKDAKKISTSLGRLSWRERSERFESQRGSEESSVVNHKCVPPPEGRQPSERPARLTHIYRSLSTCRRGALKTA